MHRARPAIALLLLTFGASLALAGDLVSLSVEGQRVENGKILEMEFHEVERTPDASIVQVKFVSGGSVSSSLFVVRGECAVARARGERYFQSEELSTRPYTYRVTFPAKTPALDSRERRGKDGIFSLDDCAVLGF